MVTKEEILVGILKQLNNVNESLGCLFIILFIQAFTLVFVYMKLRQILEALQ